MKPPSQISLATWPHFHRARRVKVRLRGVLRCSSATPIRTTPGPRLQEPDCRCPQGSIPPTCWKVVSQSSGLRETSNTSSGLAEIFIHLHFQICSTFSLYKYRGSSWTLGLTEPTCPFYLMSQLFFWPVRINIFVCWFCSSLGKRNRWQVICAFLLCI